MIRAEADLARRCRTGLRDLAVRLVHACGMPDIVADLRFPTPPSRRAARRSQAGAPILCDCRDGGARHHPLARCRQQNTSSAG